MSSLSTAKLRKKKIPQNTQFHVRGNLLCSGSRELLYLAVDLNFQNDQTKDAFKLIIHNTAMWLYSRGAL